MLRLVKPLVVVLAVPILCVAVATSARHQWDERWQAGLRREFLLRRQPVNEQVVARYSLAVLCSDGRTAATIRPCRTYNLFSGMASASVVTGTLGVLLLVGIAVAGWACRANRARLLRLFRPGLYATIAALVVLVLLHGALGVGALYVLGEVIERWPVYIVFAIAVAALLAALSMIQVALALTRKATVSVVGRLIEPALQPRLAACVRDVAASVGAEAPGGVVVGLNPGLFVTEARLVCLDGRVPGRSLYLSLPLARILSVDEFRGLVAHELAHFTGEDAAFSAGFYPAFAGAAQSVRGIGRQARGVRSVVTIPALSVLSFFLDAFGAAESPVGRRRELSADQAAVRAVGPDTFGSALVKTHAFTPAWDTVLAAMDRAVQEGTQYVNASELYAQVAVDNSIPDRLVGVGALSLSHPTDRHLPLGIRLAALGIAPRDVAAAALATRPAHPVIALLDGYEAIERDLSAVEHRLLAIGRGHLDADGTHAAVVPDGLPS